MAQTQLPTIEVGKQKKVASVARHAPPPAHPISAPRVASPAIAAPVRSPGPASPTAPAPDPNTGFQSSALQNTILGPQIQYPRVPTNLNSSSQRVFTGGQVNTLPAFRPGEALEVVPGLAVTQHSGEGKANQYYLRGFDLDHGTDLALYLDSVPLNMRTHGHGQGYADANFLMPELLETVDARKGAYNVEDGDFSNAGTIRLKYLHRVPTGVFTSTGGAFGYGRQSGMKSWEYAGGDILGAGEISTYNGPWTTPNSARKLNSVLRWSRGEDNNGLSIMGMAYAQRWNSTDQIPVELTQTNQMSRWGTMNPRDGGSTSRFSLSGRWAEETTSYRSMVEAFAMHSTLSLNNDFTYFLQYPDPSIGDQFRQFDRRTMVGGNAYHTLKFQTLGADSELKFGMQSRFDTIRVGLGNEVQRQMFNTIRNDAVDVRMIFERFVTLGSASKLARALQAEGAINKRGKRIDKGFIYRLIQNRIYLGEAVYKGTAYPGEHAAIISQKLWDGVHNLLKESPRERRANNRATSEALLKGLIFTATGAAMTPTYTRKGERLYYYYTSMDLIRNRSIAEGAGPLRLPAATVENAVITELRRMIIAPEIAARVLASFKQQNDRADEALVIAALNRFNGLWDALFPAEQARIVRLLVSKVTVGQGGISVDLRNNGLSRLVSDLSANSYQEAAA